MNYGTGICVECFAEFKKNVPIQRTCSPNCRRIYAAKRPNLTAEKKRLKRIARKKLYGI